MVTFGMVLPTMHAGADPALIDAAAEAADILGWQEVWTTDHVMVPHGEADEYARIYEAITTLAWVAGRHPRPRIGISVVVVPQRNAVVLAKELATLDDLSGGRLDVGVGAGWVHGEFVNLGVPERFAVRGAYLDETIRLWRHLWSGSREPFEGRFHRFDDFLFEPLPPQREHVPIIVGGASRGALRRAGVLGDGYQAAVTGPLEYARQVEVIGAAADAAGRPMPRLSARLNVRFEAQPGDLYALVGTPGDMLQELRAFVRAGVQDFALLFEPRHADDFLAAAMRFDREVASDLRHAESPAPAP